MCVNKHEPNWRADWLIRKLNCSLSGRNWRRCGCEGGREEGGRDGGREGGIEGGREGEREGRRKEGRERGRKRGKERERKLASDLCIVRQKG